MIYKSLGHQEFSGWTKKSATILLASSSRKLECINKEQQRSGALLTFQGTTPLGERLDIPTEYFLGRRSTRHWGELQHCLLKHKVV